jgi:hypothetical protein
MPIYNFSWNSNEIIQAKIHLLRPRQRRGVYNENCDINMIISIKNIIFLIIAIYPASQSILYSQLEEDDPNEELWPPYIITTGPIFIRIKSMIRIQNTNSTLLILVDLISNITKDRRKRTYITCCTCLSITKKMWFDFR